MKERIIGAAVLVVVVVLVVPVFLDGRPGGVEIVSERVPLPGQAEQKSQTVVLDRDRKDPVPAATGGTQAQEPSQEAPKPVVRQPQPEPVKSDPEPTKQEPVKPEPQKAAPTASTTGMWAVQLGSFGDQGNAERLAADLRKQGFAAFLSQLSTSSGPLHRVRIGPQKDRESAEAMAVRLQKAGYKGQVLTHP